MVEASEASTPTLSVFANAACISESAAISAYQRVVKPDSGKAMKSELLNEKMGSSSTGT